MSQQTETQSQVDTHTTQTGSDRDTAGDSNTDSPPTRDSPLDFAVATAGTLTLSILGLTTGNIFYTAAGIGIALPLLIHHTPGDKYEDKTLRDDAKLSLGYAIGSVLTAYALSAGHILYLFPGISILIYVSIDYKHKE